MRFAILLLGLSIAIAFFFCLGAHPYLTPSEARYIEIPRQMVVSADWVVPHLNGVPYFEKPPLFYWMQAAAFSIFGWNELAGRALTALFSTALCLLTFALGRMLFSLRAGIAAGFALALTWLGFGLSRVVLLDVPLTVFITATLLCFRAAVPAPYSHLRASAVKERRRQWIIYAMYAAAACAVLTKGLIGAILPGMIIAAWLTAARQWRIVKEMRLLSGIALFLIITLPWHIAAGLRYPQFWQFYFIHEHFARFTTEVHHRAQPWWFFLAVATIGLMPWTPFIYAAATRAKRLLPPADFLFLVLWALLPLIFFSLSHSKLIPYILPIFPPVAVLLGPFLAEAWDGAHARAIRAAAGGVGGALLLFGMAWTPLAEQSAPPPWFDPAWRLLPLGWMATAAGLFCLAPSLFSRHPRPALMALGLLTLMAGYWGQSFAAQFWRGSVKPIATYLSEKLQPEDEVVLFETYRQDLPVYLNRNITVVEYKGELEFGTRIEPATASWMIPLDVFWKRCAGERRLYVLMTKDAYAHLQAPAMCKLSHIGGMADGLDMMLLTNQESAHEQ
ncbi:MAG: phospholipid carrier-dependent glycosyltransferase [Alphaproteobacteria bacterium]|nr:phospholipid carrier-dependent glycosyltransferase [Alphaproteobacteria bacterium]